mgnify:CR=1 FL=1
MPELREKEQELQKDILDGIDTTSGKITLNQLFKMHMELKNDLRAATRENYNRIRKNLAKGAMENIKQDAGEKIPLSGDEIKRLMDFCINSGIYFVHVPFLTIAIGTCLRCGEITGLTWSDINMKKRTISVNHQLIYKNFGDGCKFHVSEPKTDAGKRIIPMTETVHRAFVELRKQNLVLGRRSDAEVDGYSNFV